MLRSVCLALGLALVACGGSDDSGGSEQQSCPETPVCEAGESEACACTDGLTGAQVCADDGSGWGKCECEAPGSGAGTGGGAAAAPKVYLAKDICIPSMDYADSTVLMWCEKIPVKVYDRCILPEGATLEPGCVPTLQGSGWCCY